MKKLLVMALVLAAMATVQVLTFQRTAAAQPQTLDYRAGTSAFSSGQAGISINFSSAMPNTNYAVTVQQTNTAGYSPTSVCTYFNVLNKTTTGFQVQHKRCDDGVPVNLDVGVSLDWIVIAYN